jgi:hypothetical protein
MSLITSHALYKTLKPTLDSISGESIQVKEVAYGKLVKTEKMKHGKVENVETAGTTFLLEKQQGALTAEDDITIGRTVTFFPKTFAKKVVVTMESMDDCQYVDQILKPAKRLMYSAKVTRDLDCAGLFINSTNTAAPGGFDALSLANSSHLLVAGGTQSNIASTYMTPSMQALMLAKAQLGQMKGPNGITDMRLAKTIVCPLIQEDVWKTILQTDKKPGTNFNDLNVVKDYKLELAAVHWLDDSSATQWGIITDAEDGLVCYEKGGIVKSTWPDDDRDILNYKVKYRMVIGWSDWRAWYQGNT